MSGGRHPERGLWALAALAGLSGIGGALGWARYVEPRRLDVTYWEVPLGGLLAGSQVSILHLTDLHVRTLALSPQRLIAALGPRALACRVLCLTGDFCDRVEEVDGVRRVLLPLLHAMALQDPRPVTSLAVWGNHDVHAGREVLEPVLSALGIRVLDNAAMAVGPLWVAGVGDLATGGASLEQAIGGVPPGAPYILLSHNPAIFRRAAAKGVPLVLSGHTHGGQVRLPGVALALGRRARYRSGWYREGDRALYVNRGIGMSWAPLRLGSPPEAAVLRLVP